MTLVPENEVIPINWIAVGNPMKKISPEKHDEIWEIQKAYNFSKTVYGIPKANNNSSSNLPEICNVMSKRLGDHFYDQLIN